jgi:hypothetical protein
MSPLCSAEEIGRLDSPAGPMTENEPGQRRLHGKQVGSGMSVESVELEHPTSLAPNAMNSLGRRRANRTPTETPPPLRTCRCFITR